MPRSCKLCEKPAKSARSDYCARCSVFFQERYELRAKAKTCKERYDRARDVFTCSYCGVPVNLTDRKSPFFRSFDHRIPRRHNDLALSCVLMNRMKTDLSVEEFIVVIRMLARHFLYGEPFDVSAVKFLYWNRKPRTKAGKPLMAPMMAWHVDKCELCGKPPVPGTLYCARCHKLATDNELFNEYKKAGLIESYDPAPDGFRCAITGVLLDIDDPYGPLGKCYDHIVPGEKRVIVVANFVNEMKTQLSLEEFKAVVIELYWHFEEGRPFRENVVKFEYWTGA
jgi:hypothetical protein